MKNVQRLTAITIWLLATAGACNGETTQTVGSETNWLGSCNSDDDCGKGRCLCGVCAEACAGDVSCGDALCLGSDESLFGRVCPDLASAPDGLCLPRCGNSAECPQGTQCEAGACVPQPRTDNLGAPCVLPFEDDPNFGGSSVDEVTIDDRYPDCAGGFCVQYHFQGRVSCPYGGEDCETTDGQPVLVDIEPQLLERAPEDTVFCSCPCDGPAGSGPFCDCPADFSCSQLIQDLGGDPFPTHYCVRPGTVLDPNYTPDSSATCDAALANCESRYCNATTCPAGNHCERGVCIPDPPPAPLCTGGKVCDGSCVEPNLVIYGCASPTCAPCAFPNVATKRCSLTGTCETVTCEAGFDDCDGDKVNGCEVNSEFDAENCGECDSICDLPRVEMQACVDGTCRVSAGACLEGWEDCNRLVADGCECEGVCNEDVCEPYPGGDGGAGGMSGSGGSP